VSVKQKGKSARHAVSQLASGQTQSLPQFINNQSQTCIHDLQQLMLALFSTAKVNLKRYMTINSTQKTEGVWLFCILSYQ